MNDNNKIKKLILWLGNVTADMDSVIGSLILGYWLSKKYYKN